MLFVQENIKRTLKGLCSHLTNKLQAECADFVETYTSELLKMLADDFTPQQICVYLKVCTDNKKPTLIPISGGDVRKSIIVLICFNFFNFFKFTVTNEIPDYTYNGFSVKNAKVEYAVTPNCMLCEQVIKEIEKNINNKNSKVIHWSFEE